MVKSTEKIKEIVLGISEKTKLNPKLILVAALLVSGMAVLMLSEMIPQKEPVSLPAETSAVSDVHEYEERLENRLVSIISAIEGAGATRVMVTLESGSEDFYLNNSDYGENIDPSGENSYEKKDEYVIVDGSSGQGGIVIRRAEPTVRGVAVVCEGAGSEKVRAQITETVTALLDISSARVSVAKMN